jgi:hypothetical protein
MTSLSLLLPLSLYLWVHGDHFSTSEDSALQSSRKPRGEHTFFFSLFSKDVIDVIDARATRQWKLLKAPVFDHYGKYKKRPIHRTITTTI